MRPGQIASPPNHSSSAALLSLVFVPGMRPDVAALSACGAADGRTGFGVTLEARSEDGYWAELLANGLTFDCHGLAPGPGAARAASGTLLGLELAPVGEAIVLQPGHHFASGAALQPVVRSLLGLAADLMTLPGVLAVCWHPSACWMDPSYFNRLAADWLGGGAFPALGLTALTRDTEGGLASQGLAFFVGQELRLSPDLQLAPDAAARLAIRLIDQLLLVGPIIEPRLFELDGQPQVLALPNRSGTRLSITRPLHVR